MEPIKEFKVNEFITLKLEEDETVIYVAGEIFQQCKQLILNIRISKISSLDNLESIDEAAERLRGQEKGKKNIPIETEFWGHCSNLQVWAELNYDTRLLHSNLAFPLLKKLVEVGDPNARRIFKDEIAERFSSGIPSVINYLMEEGYLDYLNREEFWILLESKINIHPLKELEEIFNRHVKILSIKDFYDQYVKGLPSPSIFIKKDKISKLIMSCLDLSHLPKSIGDLKELQELDLRGNRLRSLPESIGNIESLQELYLERNNLEKIPESIGNLRNLKELYLDFNQLIELPNSIGELSLLNVLSSKNNKISKLPESLGNLKSLQQLNLEHNQLESLPDTLSDLKRVWSIKLNDNQLHNLPKSLTSLKSLEVLELKNNNLKKLPESIGNLESLEILNLKNNKLKELPESIGNLKSLKILNIKNNQLKELPKSIKNNKELIQ